MEAMGNTDTGICVVHVSRSLIADHIAISSTIKIGKCFSEVLLKAHNPNPIKHTFGSSSLSFLSVLVFCNY
jgi:hypothetical protein